MPSGRLGIVWILVLMSRMRKLNMKNNGGCSITAWYTAADKAAGRKTQGM
jgi:hypothetical protein